MASLGDSNKDPLTAAQQGAKTQQELGTPYAVAAAATAASEAANPSAETRYYDAQFSNLPFPDAAHDGGTQDLANQHYITGLTEQENNYDYVQSGAESLGVLGTIALGLNVAGLGAAGGAVLAPAVASAAGGAAGSLGASAGTSAAIGTVAGDAGAGAAVGAAKGALTGGNIGTDALLGGVAGGIAGGIQASGAGDALKSTFGNTAGGAITKLGTSELTGLADSAITSPSNSKTAGSSDVVGATTKPPNLFEASTETAPVADSLGSTIDTPAASSPGFVSGLTSGLSSSLGGTAGGSIANTLGTAIGTAAPYAAVAGIGIAQANAGEAKDAQYSAQQQALAQPAISQSNTLLGDYNSGKINPTDQATSNTMVAQGNSTIQSAQGLSTIAQTAFANYNSGTLNAADQTALDQQTAAAKQQVAQQLSSAGITDSTILAAQYQQIDNNALISKQNTLNGYFNTGSTAYNQWLTATTEGQQTIQQGMEYASTSLQTELSNSMAEANIGIGEVNTAIQTQMTTDANYASQVSTLLGTLATAYAKQVAGSKSTTSGSNGANGTSAASGASQGIGSAATQQITQGTTGNVAGVSDTSQQGFDDQLTNDWTDTQNQLDAQSGAQLGVDEFGSQLNIDEELGDSPIGGWLGDGP